METEEWKNKKTELILIYLQPLGICGSKLEREDCKVLYTLGHSRKLEDITYCRQFRILTYDIRSLVLLQDK